MLILQTFLSYTIIASAFCVSFAENPIDCVLFLIITFVSSGALLFLHNVEFFGLILIIVYVGAIAVLFLFVIMMLNIKSTGGFMRNITSFLFAFVFFVPSCAILTRVLENTFSTPSSVSFGGYEVENSILFDSLTNIEVLGQVLYNYFVFGFLIAGLILLVALVGAIVLTLRFNRAPKKQIVSRQLSRTDNFTAFFR